MSTTFPPPPSCAFSIPSFMAPLLLAFSPTTISREAADWTTTQLASSPLLVRLPAGCSGETEKQDQESGWSGVEGSRTPSPKPTPQINILPTTVYQENPVPLFITGPGAGIPSSPSRTPIAHRRVTVRFSTCAFPSSPLLPPPPNLFRTPGVWIVRGLETTFTYVHHVVCTRVKYTSMHPLIPRS